MSTGSMKNETLPELMNSSDYMEGMFNSIADKEREEERDRKRLAEKEKIFEQQLQKCANKPDNRPFKDMIVSIEELEMFFFNMFKQGAITALRGNKDFVEAFQNLDIHERFNEIREKRTK